MVHFHQNHSCSRRVAFFFFDSDMLSRQDVFMSHSKVSGGHPGGARNPTRRVLFVAVTILSYSFVNGSAQTLQKAEIGRLEQQAEADLRDQKPEMAIVSYRRILA